MDKREFYHQVHEKLGKKYNLLSSQINFIRSSSGENKNRKQIAELLIIKVNLPKRHKVHLTGKILPRSKSRSNSKNFYQTLLNFVASCSQDAWDDITRYIPFNEADHDVPTSPTAAVTKRR